MPDKLTYSMEAELAWLGRPINAATILFLYRNGQFKKGQFELMGYGFGSYVQVEVCIG